MYKHRIINYLHAIETSNILLLQDNMNKPTDECITCKLIEVKERKSCFNQLTTIKKEVRYLKNMRVGQDGWEKQLSK